MKGGGFGIMLEADSFNPQRLILWCLACKADGRRWILPDCPHSDWETGADHFRAWMDRLRAKLRPRK